MKPTEQNKTRANKSLSKKFIAMLVIGLTAALYPTNIYSQCPTTPVPPPCASGANKTLYSNFSSPYDWTEATGIFATGEQMTIRPAAFSTSTNLFVSEYLFRSDGGRLAQLSPIFPAGGSNPSYTYGLGNRWNFLGDDLQSPLSHSSSGTFRRVSGFHNFDNETRTVFGSYTDNIYATTLVTDPVIYWQADNSAGITGPVGSRLRFIFKDADYPYGSETELATLTDSGNFGLNSTSPLSRLELLGGLYVGDQTATIAALPGFIYANGGILMGSETFISSVPNNVFIATYPGSTTGIGIAAPTAYLHVFSTSSSTLNEFKITNSSTGSSQTDGFSIKLVSSTVKIVNHENADMEFHTNGTVRVKIDGSGDLLPGSDDLYTFGNGSYCWNELFCTNSTINNSDINLKKDILELDYGLKEIMNLKPVSYHWKEKDNGRRLGFIAQNVQKVIEEVIVESIIDTLGTVRLGMRYSELIPVLVNAVQEQQKIIENYQVSVMDMQNKLIELQKDIENLKGTNIPENKNINLYQNEPNPFSGKTTIKYKINQNFKQANIEVRDINAQLVSNFLLENKQGDGKIEFEGSNFKKGAYTYTLIVDDTIIDTKKLLLTY